MANARKAAKAKRHREVDLDQEVEIIGTLLWAAFSRGAHPCRFGRDVIDEGRKRAKDHLRRNIENDTLALDFTVECAEDCGRASKRLSDGEMISVEMFQTAWDLIHDQRKGELQALARTRARSGDAERNPRKTGGACG